MKARYPSKVCSEDTVSFGGHNNAFGLTIFIPCVVCLYTPIELQARTYTN